MTIALPPSRYRPRFATDTQDLVRCQNLRGQRFKGPCDQADDLLDQVSDHLMVEDTKGGLVATARLLTLTQDWDWARTYAAQSYDLSGLRSCDGPMIELGRFCTIKGALDPDILRISWAALTARVDAVGARFVFGASSFSGTDPAPYGQAFAWLAQKALGPTDLRPVPKGVAVHPISHVAGSGRAPMPPLLRSYVALGAWVGDSVVVDHDLKTLHLFTCLDVHAVPARRAARLRALAADSGLA